MKQKKIINQIINYTISFILLTSIILIIFIKNNKSFVWINVSNDGLDQHLTNLYLFKSLFNNFLNTRTINTFIWNIGYGIDMFANLAYYIFGDFLSYASLLVKNENLDILYNIIIIIRIYLVGISFLIYGNYKKLSPTNNIIGALSYTFSAFTLFSMARHPYFINPLIIFPLLMMGTEKSILENKHTFFTLIVTFTFITSFYFGYMMSICVMIYGIIIAIYNNKDKKTIIKKLLNTLLHAIIGVLLSSFILIPTAYGFLTSTRTDNSFYVYGINYYINLIETLISVNNTGNWTIIGLSGLILAILPQYIKNKQKHKETYIYIIILLIPILIPFVGSILSGFSYPNNRWTFIINFILSYIIALILDKDYEINIKKNILYIAIYTIIIWLTNDLNSQLIISIICSVIFIIIIKYKQKIKLYPFLLLTILIINLGYNIKYMFIDNKYINEFVETNATSLYDNGNYQIKHLNEAVNYIKDIDNSFYNINIYPCNLYNLSITNNYNSISYFYSIVNNNYLKIAQDLENQDLELNKEIRRFNNRTKITSLLNNKYIITTEKNNIPYGYELLKEYHNETYIYKNKYHLSFATLYTNYINEEYYNNLSPLEKENALLEATITKDKDNYKINNNIDKLNYTTVNKNINNNKIIIDNKLNNKITLYTETTHNKEIYLYIKNIKFKPSNSLSKKYSIEVKINNKTIIENQKDKYSSPYYFENKNILINLGYYENWNNQIEISFNEPGTYSFDSFEILAMNFNNYEKIINDLNKSNFIIKKYDNNYLKGEINPEENGIIQFSTNYSDGWSVYVDGKKVNTIISNKYFLGINIEKGYHQIELKYITPYQKEGLILTIIGIILFIYKIFIERRKINEKN